MSHEWSGVVSAEVKEEYMTLQGRLQDYSLPHCSTCRTNPLPFPLDEGTKLQVLGWFLSLTWKPWRPPSVSHHIRLWIKVNKYIKYECQIKFVRKGDFSRNEKETVIMTLLWSKRVAGDQVLVTGISHRPSRFLVQKHGNIFHVPFHFFTRNKNF